MKQEEIKKYLENDENYKTIKIITIDLVSLIQLLINKGIITEKELESAIEVISNFYEEKEKEAIDKAIESIKGE